MSTPNMVFKIKKIEGMDKVLGVLVTKGGKLAAAGGRALSQEANAILKEAMDQTPVETGTLRRSGTVDDPKTGTKGVTVEIGFNTDYAIFVHENMNAHHEQGKAKFLEDPINAAAPGLPGRLAARLKVEL